MNIWQVVSSSSLDYGDIMKMIAEHQRIEGFQKMKNTKLASEIIKSEKLSLFIDDIERATAKLN